MVRVDDSGSVTKCWIDYEDEVPLLEQYARDREWTHEIAVQLMTRVGCRASGVPSATPNGLQWESKGEYWKLQILGKNTKGGSKTTRDAYVPDRVKNNLDRYASERYIDYSEPYVDVSVSSIRRWVREITDDIAEATGDERWESVSTHDLRRSWAHTHLVEEDVPIRVMMDIGGWSSYDAIEPYLSKPTPTKIGSEMSSVEL